MSKLMPGTTVWIPVIGESDGQRSTKLTKNPERLLKINIPSKNKSQLLKFVP
ncbi:MAG TPA: hypothetical protein VHP36_10345 [Chitinispirillaceae bacterium]|nr:hypothetical protein [Chitinispirillaceae bacterium]